MHCYPLESSPRGWSAIDAAFEAIPATPFGQAWLDTPEPGFRPGSVRMGYGAGGLYVFAELHDDDVFNPVTEFNEPAFQKGDVLEVFVHSPGCPFYFEVHSTPGAAVFQLRLDAGQPRAFLGDNPVATPVSRAVTRKTPRGWSACVEIPFELTGSVPGPGSEWRASVCRYDYTRGCRQPVLSSTSPLTKADFHQTENWNTLLFR